MSQCVFCLAVLSPGSEEHVFPSALGGRIATRHATCSSCNQALSRGTAEESLARAFELVRCALMIWTGRDAPPPTLRRAGRLSDNLEYDLAPGLIAIPRPASVPRILPGQTEGSFQARDLADARRLFEIFRWQGLDPFVKAAQSVTSKAPEAKIDFSVDCPAVFRSVAKMAIAGSCLMYGNETARRFIAVSTRDAARFGRPDISDCAGWDAANPWPDDISLEAHPRCHEAKCSGFEHSLFVCEVEGQAVAYVTLFGHFRFSVWLGPATGLESKGLAANPRSSTYSRFTLTARSPSKYVRRTANLYERESEEILNSFNLSLSAVLGHWEKEASKRHVDSLYEELHQQVEGETDERARDLLVEQFCEKILALESGDSWREDIDRLLVDDQPEDKPA